ncbi:hypothetical protein CPB83DRAFT_934636, partial [Crepidotus variabilis]
PIVSFPNSPWARTFELKKNLALVNQAWCDVATFFLYEDITIRRLPQLFQLLFTLSRPSCRNLGPMIRTLELKCYIPEPVGEEFGQTLRTALAHCTSLSGFSYFSQCRLPLRVFTGNLLLPTSIRQLHLDLMLEEETAEKILRHLQGELSYLRMRIQRIRRVKIQHLVFPCLRTVWFETDRYSIHRELEVLETWTMPSLERFIISNGQHSDDSYHFRTRTVHRPSIIQRGEDQLFAFLSQSGGKLKYFSTMYRGHSEFVQQILDCCPLLERLSLFVRIYDADFESQKIICRICSHKNLRCVDFVLENEGSLELAFVAKDIQSLVEPGLREFFGLPPFLNHWFH